MHLPSGEVMEESIVAAFSTSITLTAKVPLRRRRDSSVLPIILLFSPTALLNGQNRNVPLHDLHWGSQEIHWFNITYNHTIYILTVRHFTFYVVSFIFWMSKCLYLLCTLMFTLCLVFISFVTLSLNLLHCGIV